MVEPGPWEIDEEGRIYHRRGPLSRYIIANMESGDEENWRLVAAAPDMLLALEDVMKRIYDCEEWWIDEPTRGGFDTKIIKAAISKAKGEDNVQR